MLFRSRKQLYVKYKSTEHLGVMEQFEVLDEASGTVKQFEMYDNISEFIENFEETKKAKNAAKAAKKTGLEKFMED